MCRDYRLTALARLCHGCLVTEHNSGPMRRWLAIYLGLRAVVITVLGILLLIRPDDTVRTLARVAGAVLLVLGTIDIGASLTRGALSSIRGLIVFRGALTVGVGGLLLAITDATVTVLALLLGMQLVVGGGVSLLVSVRLRRRVAAWQWVAVRGVLTLGVGVAALFWPGLTVASLAILVGVQWILGGIVSTAVAVAVAARPGTA